ncbi:VirK/YbjX family protein [Actinobacillus delphinicola]|uniref:Protein of uncharacterized function (DUF535) n=1 Tax=Actinobacillus delphinicola TaxID=51161 RepID=A0A448TTZ8_9PAST|nr:DUF535 family protein [Actinobacillus delphinicola]VEJ09472.1 Protein of uncharacterised function (DUF535) [Actinobacillus delphinicola]
MQNIYCWPTAQAIYPDRNNKSYAAKRFRYNLRSFLNRSRIKAFERFVNQNPYLIPLLNARPNFSYPIAHRFLDKRFSGKKRLQEMCENLRFLPERLAQLGADSVLEKNIVLATVMDDYELRLGINTFQPMEGFWNIELFHKANDELIYLLTFGKIEDALLIAVIQGPNQEGSKEMVKQLTKVCHGLRPAYLMVEVMKMVTDALGYSRLLGIPQKYQNKSRFIKSSSFVVDYDAIFGESKGTLKAYWELPLALESRDLEEIPSKKRSMYRKRYAMLHDIAEQVKTALHA